MYFADLCAALQRCARKRRDATSRLAGLSVAAACALAALAQAAPAEAGGAPPPLGTYACASYRTFVGVVISSIGTLHLVTPSRYELDVGNMATGKSVPARGTYVVALTHGGKHPDTPKLTFTGPVLGGHWGYVNLNKDGSIHAIVFPDDEAEKPFDQGATFCYYQKPSGR